MIKQNFADQLKAQSDVWMAQVKDYQERLEQMGEKARADHVRGANEAAWKDMVNASQKAFAELQRGWAEAIGRFQ
jgi:hypothetical protein